MSENYTFITFHQDCKETKIKTIVHEICHLTSIYTVHRHTFQLTKFQATHVPHEFVNKGSLHWITTSYCLIPGIRLVEGVHLSILAVPGVRRGDLSYLGSLDAIVPVVAAAAEKVKRE